MRVGLFLTACVIAHLALPRSGAAQDDARASAAARALFQEGVTCADAEDWPCAVERFGRAYALRASPVIASNYGVALSHVGRIVEAAETFRSVLRDPSTSPALRAEATRHVAELEPRAGRITLHVVGPMDGVTITMDGHDETSLLDVAAPADPGDHRVEAHRDGAVIATATAHVEAAAATTLEISVPERARPESTEAVSVAPVVREDPSVASASIPPSEPPAEHHEVYEEWWFWTLIGVVVVGAGVTVGVVASQPGTTLPMGSLGTIDARP